VCPLAANLQGAGGKPTAELRFSSAATALKRTELMLEHTENPGRKQKFSS